MNHYERLGIRESASVGEIRKAFGKLAKSLHPDVNKEPAAVDQFRQVKEAYDVLSQPDRRRNYDAVLKLEAQLRAKQEAEQVRVRTESAQSKQAAEQQRQNAEKQQWVAQKERLNRLERVMAQARWNEAETLIGEILSFDGRCAVAYAARADIARMKGEISEAQKNYAYAVQYDTKNEMYQRRYEELIDASRRPGSEQVRDASDLKVGPTLVMVFVVLIGAAYVVMAKEQALFPNVKPVDQLSLGLFVMLFVSGLTIGASLTASNALDSVDTGLGGAIVKIPPPVILGFVAVVNFWIGVGLYVMMGFSQAAFNRSLSRLLGFSGLGLFVFVLAMWTFGGRAAVQTLAWGGNLVYIGAACGWFVADSLRKV